MKNTLCKLSVLTLAIGLAACSLPRQQQPASADRASQAASQTSLEAAIADAFQASQSGLQSEADQLAYSSAVQRAAELWAAQRDEKTVSGSMTKAGGWNLAASWPSSLHFDELLPATTVEDRKMRKQVTRPGIGACMLARWRHTPERKKAHPFLSEGGYLAAVTAILDFPASSRGSRQAVLRLHEPRTEETAMIRGRRQPLAADFSAASEFILQEAKKKHLGMPGLGALRHSEKYLDKLGILALEPPSRDRIPLIFVHGLMSRPLTWHNAFNELNGDPVIRKNFQIFFFRYPTGVPVVYSSAKFRENLNRLHDELSRIGNHHASHHMMLIGHSMGGLVSKMQLASSGDRLWVNILGAKPADLGLSKAEYEEFRSLLEFHPNPHIDRVIFVCTPHRGSKLAEGIVGAIGRKLVSLPTRMLGSAFDLLQGEALQNSHLKQLLKRGIPSSIDNLSPESPFVKNSMQLPLKPGLHVHSIIGNKEGKPLADPKCSDGVVPYASAHLDGVESELVVRSDHGAHETEAGIAEMRRILLLHLKGLR